MRRRELLGVAAGAVAGCATLRSEPDENDFRARLDRGLLSIGNPFQKIAPGAKFTSEERSFVTSALRSLLVTAAVHEVPRAQRDAILLEPARARVPDFQHALGSAQAILQMPPADQVRIEHQIRRDPSLPEKVTEMLARYARSSGVPGAGRFELRSLAQRCAWRMRHQPISLVMDDTLERMRKVQVRLGEPAARARTLLAQAQEKAVLGTYDEDDELGEEKGEKKDPAPIEESAEKLGGPKDEIPARGKHLMISGGISAGGGLVLGAAGFGLFFASFNGDSEFLGILSLVMCGIGALALIVGLVVLIVGIVIRANDVAEHRRASETP